MCMSLTTFHGRVYEILRKRDPLYLKAKKQTINGALLRGTLSGEESILHEAMVLLFREATEGRMADAEFKAALESAGNG
jgi:hypothetical protein